MNTKKIYLVFVLFLVANFVAFCQNTSIQNIKIPTFSIDSLFKVKNLKDGELYANRLLISVENVLKLLAKDGGLEYYPNYRLNNKIKTDYSIHLTMGYGKSDVHKFRYESPYYYYLGEIWDNYKDSLISVFGCANDKKGDVCFCYEGLDQDSICSMIKVGLTMGITLKDIVPMKIKLNPIRVEGVNLLSFSIDDFIKCDNKNNKIIADNLTHLINNTVVYNLQSYPRAFFINSESYNYYNNYALIADKKKKSDFVIGATLKEIENNQYRIDFNFKSNSKEMNLVAPSPQQMSVVLDKKRLKSCDYSEAMLKINPVIISFILKQLM